MGDAAKAKSYGNIRRGLRRDRETLSRRSPAAGVGWAGARAGGPQRRGGACARRTVVIVAPDRARRGEADRTQVPRSPGSTFRPARTSARWISSSRCCRNPATSRPAGCRSIPSSRRFAATALRAIDQERQVARQLDCADDDLAGREFGAVAVGVRAVGGKNCATAADPSCCSGGRRGRRGR